MGNNNFQSWRFHSTANDFSKFGIINTKNIIENFRRNQIDLKRQGEEGIIQRHFSSPSWEIFSAKRLFFKEQEKIP